MERSESVTVTIFGREYTLRGEADPEYVRRIAAFVDERMGEVARGGVGATDKVAILAAVNIADELFREQRKRMESEACMEDRSVHIARLLSSAVANGPVRDDGGDSLPGT